MSLYHALCPSLINVSTSQKHFQHTKLIAFWTENLIHKNQNVESNWIVLDILAHLEPCTSLASYVWDKTFLRGPGESSSEEHYILKFTTCIMMYLVIGYMLWQQHWADGCCVFANITFIFVLLDSKIRRWTLNFETLSSHVHVRNYRITSGLLGKKRANQTYVNLQ